MRIYNKRLELNKLCLLNIWGSISWIDEQVQEGKAGRKNDGYKGVF